MNSRRSSGSSDSNARRSTSMAGTMRSAAKARPAGVSLSSLLRRSPSTGTSSTRPFSTRVRVAEFTVCLGCEMCRAISRCVARSPSASMA